MGGSALEVPLTPSSEAETAVETTGPSVGPEAAVETPAPSSGPGHDVEALGVGLSIPEVAQMAEQAVAVAVGSLERLVEATDLTPVKAKPAEPPSGPSGSVVQEIAEPKPVESEPKETELKSAVEEIVEITETEPVSEKVPKAVPKKAMPKPKESGVAKNKARPKILGSVAASFAMAAMHKKKEKASLSAGPPKPILVQKGGDLEAEGGANPAGSSSTRANQRHPVEPAGATASSKAFCDASGLAEPLAASSGSFDTGALDSNTSDCLVNQLRGQPDDQQQEQQKLSKIQIQVSAGRGDQHPDPEVGNSTASCTSSVAKSSIPEPSSLSWPTEASGRLFEHVVHDCGMVGSELAAAEVEDVEQSVDDPVWWILKDSDIDFDLAGHVLRGHLPYSSSCEVCVRSRGLPKPARERPREEVMKHEVQVDQFFRSSKRFIVLVHVQSFALGCVDGEAGRPVVIEQMGSWLLYFGLANVREGVVLRCDAEPYIRTLLNDVLEAHSVLHGPVEQFNPSRHAPAAERGVRTLRELANTLLVDMEDHGVSLRETSRCFSLLYSHCAQVHNRYSKASASDLSPLQRLRGNTHKPHQLYVFGSTVCACSPAASSMVVGRFAFGCYLGPVMGKTSHLVNLKLKDGTLKVVQAKSIKVVMPLRFDLDLMGSFGRRATGAIHGPPRPLGNPDDSETVPLSLTPQGNPPAEYFRQHGPTRRCGACRQGGTHGLNHSKGCRQRYYTWLREQKMFEPPASAPAELEPDLPVVEVELPVIVLQVQIFIFHRKFSNLHDEKISAFSPGQALTRAGKEFFLWPRVARLEAHFTTMDLPFVEDRLDNMETVVAALGREFDALAQRLEDLQRQIRRVEAAVCSLERERRSINDLADRISNLEIASRQETQRALEYHQIVLEELDHRVASLESPAHPDNP